VGVWGSDVDDVDVGIACELMVGAVCFCGGGGFDVAEEGFGAGFGRGGCCCCDDVLDVAYFAGGGVGEEVFGESWIGGLVRIWGLRGGLWTDLLLFLLWRGYPTLRSTALPLRRICLDI